MENKLTHLNSDTVEKLLIKGDLSSLSTQEKVQYYNGFCQRLGLDPFTQPFKLLKMNGKEVLYCDRSGTQQLSNLHHVSHEIKAREVVNDCYVVTAKALTPTGRHTESIGAVSIGGAKGDLLCNIMMKAETKAKRRATLDLLGLGVLDESEIETIPNATIKSITEEAPKDTQKFTQEHLSNILLSETITKTICEIENVEKLMEYAKNQTHLKDNKEFRQLVINRKNELKKPA